MNEIETTINQKKFDCLVAKRLHKRRRQNLNKLNLLVDSVALITPIIGLSVRFVLKGGQYAEAADNTWVIMAGVLLALTFLKLVCHWQGNAQLHSKLMGENISIVSVADALLLDKSKITADLPAFRQLLDKSETDDSELLGEPSAADKHWAYREALKEADKIAAKCPICERSAWKFKNKWWQFWGDDKRCQACGNTD